MYFTFEDDVPRSDFRYNIKGEYHNRQSSPPEHPFRKKEKSNRSEVYGKTCPGCGIKRSRTNKCFCNE